MQQMLKATRLLITLITTKMEENIKGLLLMSEAAWGRKNEDGSYELKGNENYDFNAGKLEDNS